LKSRTAQTIGDGRGRSDRDGRGGPGARAGGAGGRDARAHGGRVPKRVPQHYAFDRRFSAGARGAICMWRKNSYC